MLTLVVGPASATAAPGDVDRSFSGDGRVVTDLQSGSKDEARAAVVDGSGRLLLAGHSIKPPQGVRLAVARYLPDGGLDPTFAAAGVFVSDAEGGMVATDVAVDSAGRVVLAGFHPSDDLMVARLLPDGRLDPSFSGNGVLRVDIPLEANALAIDPLGRIVVAGEARVPGRVDFAAARLRPNGTFDPTFGGEGAIAYDLGGRGPDSAADVFVDSFGRIVLTGGAWLDVPEKQRNIGHFALLRLHDNGSPDDSMRGDGGALIAMNRRGAFATAAALDGVGNTILAGRAAPFTGLTKVRGAGGLDKRFGQNGRAKLATRGSLWAKDLEIDRAGRPIAAIGAPGFASQDAGPLIAVRLRSNGRPDRSFSRDSRALARFGQWRATASALALYGGGGIAVAGTARRAGAEHSDFAAVRFRGG